jgi:hypothetical protein
LAENEQGSQFLQRLIHDCETKITDYTAVLDYVELGPTYFKIAEEASGHQAGEEPTEDDRKLEKLRLLAPPRQVHGVQVAASSTEKSEDAAPSSDVTSPPTGPTPNLTSSREPIALDPLKHALILRRQVLLYLDALHEQMQQGKQHLVSLKEKFDGSIDDLKATCRAKAAVPVDQVYPLFMTLSAIWTSFQDTLFIFALRHGIVETLEYFIRQSDEVTTVPKDILELAQKATTEANDAAYKYVRKPEAESESDKVIIEKGKLFYYPKDGFPIDKRKRARGQRLNDGLKAYFKFWPSTRERILR